MNSAADNEPFQHTASKSTSPNRQGQIDPLDCSRESIGIAHRNGRWLRIASLGLVLLTVVLSNAALASGDAQTPAWADTVSEFVILAFAATWVLILDPTSVVRPVYYALWGGALLVAAGSVQHLISGFYESAIIGLETLSLPLGMASITAGLILWFRSTRDAYRRLEESKKRYERLSRTDALTDLYNSRYYYEQLTSEMQRARRYRRDLSLLFLDIDDFKEYNDTYGHVAGDKVLKSLGLVIRSNLRENDSGYRYGGEEFTVLLPETDRDEAVVVAERIRKEFAEIRFDQPDGRRRKTISVGIASLRPDDDEKALTKRADTAMYQAKMRGKNVCHVSE